MDYGNEEYSSEPYLTDDEGYWQALLEQGEHPPEAALPLHERVTSAEAPPDHSLADVRSAEERFGPEAPSVIHGGERLPTFAERRARDWETLATSFQQGEPLDVRVIGYNKGGLLVRLGEVDGFVPASQLVDLPSGLSPEELRAELDSYVGQDITLRIIEMDRERDRLILSERASTPGRLGADALLASLERGDVVRGRVRNLCDFGIFVDLGGIDGLIHISELSWGRVQHPGEVAAVGDEIDVYVMDVDRNRRRIALSLKRLHPDPWSLVDERYEVGQLVEGTVTNVVDFGAFVRLEEGLEGLVHISELAEGNFLHPRNVVKEGDTVTVRILQIDSQRHRLALSLRQAFVPSEAADELAWPDELFEGDDGKV